MLFNSIEFAIFLPLVFFCYWFIVNKNLKFQNFFIVAVSYIFYGWWDWRFLFLIALTTGASYLSGILIERHREKKTAKGIAAINIALNLLILCIFKYFNFFAENLNALFEMFGYSLDWVTLDILLPVGISFYTFQALSYTIDVYKRKMQPTHDVVSFFAFVSFFPQLVAGPIERATNLLPQFYVPRQFDYANAVNGMRQMLWGLFKKIVVADNCAVAVNMIFSDPTEYSGSTLALGVLLFAFQIYGDFSGYSDIAIGASRLFGFNLMQNFNFPYFSRDIAEFWRRWHISLTTWFRDYIYIPLGGSRGTKWMSFRNTIAIFLISGLWHGANWTFIAWGAYHALLFAPLLLLGRNRKYSDIVAKNRFLPNIKEIFQILLTFILVLIGWVFFRADTIGDSVTYLTKMFSPSLFSMPVWFGKKALLAIGVMLAVEWIGRRNRYGIEKLPQNTVLRYAIYCAIICFILIGGQFGNNQFIYFQF